MGHSEENKRDEWESEELILSKQNQKEGNDDDIVNTDTDTDISETNERDDDLIHSDNDQDTNIEESEEKYQIIERSKDILELGHSEENKRYELENEELILSKQTKKKKMLMI